jgi:DNA polymerase-1
MTEVKRKKLVIIDGKSVFYRGYYAMPNLSTKDGTPTGGVYGFATMALEVLKRLKPDYVCVAWDKPKTNIRKRLELYPKYKAGRKPPPADFYEQIPVLHEVLEAFGWPLYELDDYEADDIMGTLAVQAREAGLDTALVTSDLDLLQVINGNVHVYALKKGLSNIELFHPESFEAKYDIKVDQFLDLKSIKGDSSDNIPGVPGIGEKGAVELLKRFETLDGVYENLGLVKDSLRLKLEAGKDSAYLSKKLAAIWTDAPVKLNLDDLDISKCNPQEIHDILQRLEFRSLVRQLPEVMQITNKDETGNPKHETRMGSGKTIMVVTDVALQDVKLTAKISLIVHSRAAGKHGKNPQLLILSDSKEGVYVLDLSKLSKSAVTEFLISCFDIHPEGIIGYDVKSTLKVLLELGVSKLPDVEHDVLVGAFLVNSLIRLQSLTELAETSLGYDGSNLDEIDEEELVSRASEVISVIRELYSQQAAELKTTPKVQQLANLVEWPVTPVLARMEHTGIELNTKYLNDFSKEINKSVADYEQQIYKLAGSEFNIASPSQLSEVLFTKLALPIQFIKKGKTSYSTAASELDKLRDKHPIIDVITQYREVTKLKNTYVDTLPKMVDENSRLHTTFNLTIAQTGRLSSVDPNLQNIPVRTDLGKRIRTAFVAGKGNVLVSADYSQFELRIAAALSGDEGMIKAFNSDADIHIETAAAIYGIPSSEVTKQMRYSAKAVNFGIMYGQGPHGLSAGTGMPFKEAREFIAKYFEIRPKLKTYIEELRQKAKTDGYVEDLLGRRRPTPDVHSSNFVVREAAYRAAINMPVQGTAADLMKLAMVHIQKHLDESPVYSHQSPEVQPKQLLQIHDAVLVECREEDAKDVAKLLKTTMESVYDLGVKIKVDVSTGKTWGDV